MSFRSKLSLSSILGLAMVVAGCGGGTNTNNAYSNANVNRAPAPSPAPTVNCANGNMTREEYEKNKSKCEEQKGSSTIGQGIDDSWIWFKTRAALLTTSDLRESTINVDVVNGVITLKGTVADAAQKASAEKVAKGIDGQKGVKNQLTIAPKDSATNHMLGGNSKSAPTKPANTK